MRNRLAANIRATIRFRKYFSKYFLKEKCGEFEVAGLKQQACPDHALRNRLLCR
jgi:hypothetical protein